MLLRRLSARGPAHSCRCCARRCLSALVPVGAPPPPARAAEFGLGFVKARNSFLDWAKYNGALTSCQTRSDDVADFVMGAVTGNHEIGGELPCHRSPPPPSPSPPPTLC